MKARVAKLVAPRKFEVFDEELRGLKDNEVLLRIKACGICHSEMPQYRGQATWIDNKEGQHIGIAHKIDYPLTLGHEPSGVIEDVGSGIRNFKAGDRVAGLVRKAFASHSIGTTERITKVPKEVPLEHALGEPLMCLSTILGGANPALGDYIGIVGCGAMGLLVVAGLSRSAAREIIAIDLIASRLEIAKELGATSLLNPKKVDVEDEIRRITRGKGLDIVVEITGKGAGFALAVELVKICRGKILIPSYYAEPETLGGGFHLMVKSPIIHSTHPWYSPNYVDDLEKGMWALEKGILPMGRLITHKFKLEDIGKGFEMAETGAGGYIKGIVMPEL